jgi:amicyanin
MNKSIIAVLVFSVVLVGGYFLFNSKQPTGFSDTNEVMRQNASDDNDVVSDEALEEAEVVISNYAYSPKTVKIKAGGTVTWTNNDNVEHTATGDKGEFDTGLIGKGQSKSITFDNPGTYSYHCTPHPYMQGSVIVE